VPVPADDDVIVHRDPERLRDLRDLPRRLDIGTRRSRIAGGMIVDDAITGPYRNENKQEIVY
jgi:hypothetical protein